MPNKKYVTWEDVEACVDAICETYKDSNFKGIYGLPRGGLCIATMVSYRLNIPLLMAPIRGCLIFDDISDTGETLLHYKSGAYDKYEVATMYYRKGSLVKPDFYFAEKADDWIVFPWEEKQN